MVSFPSELLHWLGQCLIQNIRNHIFDNFGSLWFYFYPILSSFFLTLSFVLILDCTQKSEKEGGLIGPFLFQSEVLSLDFIFRTRLMCAFASFITTPLVSTLKSIAAHWGFCKHTSMGEGPLCWSDVEEGVPIYIRILWIVCSQEGFLSHGLMGKLSPGGIKTRFYL